MTSPSYQKFEKRPLWGRSQDLIVFRRGTDHFEGRNRKRSAFGILLLQGEPSEAAIA